MPSLLILIPLFGIIILNLPFQKVMKKIAFWFAFSLFFIQIALAIFHYSGFLASRSDFFDPFFMINFTVDHLSFIMLLCTGIVLLTSLLAARSTIDDEQMRFNFINLLMVSSIGMSGVIMVEDIFSLYIFLEITAISSFILISFRKDINALECAFKYIILSAVASILMLSAIALILIVSGYTSFASIQTALKISHNSFIVRLAIGGFLCGLFIKGGLVPFHWWVPDAYSQSPSPVSILLAGIVTKVSGIYVIIRIITSIYGFDETIKSVFLLIGAVSILFGAFAAIGQNNFKRMLAYSSISQVGYIVLSLGTGTALGFAGAVFHLFNHSIFKTLLFVNASAVEQRLGTMDMDKMRGLQSRMPFTAATSIVAFLSTSGIPPLSGFWSKLIIILALWQSGHYFYACLALTASIVTLAYFLILQRKVFFGKLLEGLEQLKEADYRLITASVVLALIIIGVGLFFPFVLNNLILPVQDIIK